MDRLRAFVIGFAAAFFAGGLSIAFATTPAVPAAHATQPALVITGGTLIDVSEFGQSENDIDDAVVVIRGEVIESAGPRGSVAVPTDAIAIDATGGFLVPGYIEGFGGLRNQSFATAYLALGVTGVVGVGDEGWRRGPLFTGADPGPFLYPVRPIGLRPDGTRESPARTESSSPMGTTEELLRVVEAYHARGVRVVHLLYQLPPETLRALVKRCRELGIATMGELGASTVREALDAGVQSFVHTQRYLFDPVADDELRRAYAAAPFSTHPDGPVREFQRRLREIDPEDPRLADYAALLGSSKAALIPTLAMVSSGFAWTGNPWSWSAARLIDPALVNEPLDPVTGKWAEGARFAGLARGAPMFARFERMFARAGARYLAGSGVPAFGTLPGVSLHFEMEILVRECGQTPRQALAAATGNYAAIYGWSDCGVIERGRRADLVILNADPRIEVKHLRDIRLVIARGQRLDPVELLRSAPGGETRR